MEKDINKMNLLPLIKTNNLMELLPKILNVEKENFKVFLLFEKTLKLAIQDLLY